MGENAWLVQAKIARMTLRADDVKFIFGRQDPLRTTTRDGC
jgi:hypothetical protein